MIGSSRKLLQSPNESPDFRAFNAIDSNSAASKSRSRPPLNHDIFRSWNGKQVYLRDEDEEEEEEYGFRSSPHRSPPFFRSSYQSLSPPSKARAIASGQKELMEMVSNMPESCYELSLRDLVEPPIVLGQQDGETLADERDFNFGADRAVISKSNNEIRPLLSTTTSTGRMAENGGLYLKMGFPKPVATRSATTTKKKNKSDSGLNLSSKVSPKPPQLVEKDWWKRSLVNNGSIKSSTSSSSSSGSTKNRAKFTGRHNRSGGCWSCLYPKYNERDE